jgi:hypothetical protein
MWNRRLLFVSRSLSPSCVVPDTINGHLSKNNVLHGDNAGN